LVGEEVVHFLGERDLLRRLAVVDEDVDAVCWTGAGAELDVCGQGTEGGFDADVCRGFVEDGLQ
jgi:hypothetical protein